MEPRRKYITGQYRAAFDLDRKDNTLIEDSHQVFIYKDDEQKARSLLIDKNEPGLFHASEFEWGNRSKGTKQLATSILLEFTNHFETARFSDFLVNECLSLIPSKNDFEIQIFALERWIKSKRGLPDQETDLMLWVKIETPDFHKKPPTIDEALKNTKIIPVPSLPVNEPSKGEKKMNIRQGRSRKYPTDQLTEIGSYFYFINPAQLERKNLFNAVTVFGINNNRKYSCRSMTAQWAREHGIAIAQDTAEVCIVMRIK